MHLPRAISKELRSLKTNTVIL